MTPRIVSIVVMVWLLGVSGGAVAQQGAGETGHGGHDAGVTHGDAGAAPQPDGVPSASVGGNPGHGALGSGDPAQIRAQVTATMHPAVRVLDQAGRLVTDAHTMPSADKTCGACHDVKFIHKTMAQRPGHALAGCFDCHLPGSAPGAPTATAALAASSARADLRRADGSVLAPISAPTNQNCGTCHGLVCDKKQYLELPNAFLEARVPGRFATTLRTGEVHSAQHRSASFLNLKDKAALSYPWDIHAARGLKCISCHFAGNNPARAGFARTKADDQPLKRGQKHLVRDPRTLQFGRYLKRPDHALQSASCRSCHDPSATHKQLPYRKRHMATLACQACHVPRLSAPALRTLDRAVVTAQGRPATTFRGAQQSEHAPPSTWFIAGYRPFLLSEGSGDKGQLAPYNVLLERRWVSGDASIPVSAALVDRAWRRPDGSHHPELVSLLDSDGDHKLADAELTLDAAPRVAAVAARLQALGVKDPRLDMVVSAHPVRHGVVEGKLAAGDCASCHSERSRLGEAIDLGALASVDGASARVAADSAAVLSAYGLDNTTGSLRLVHSGSAKARYVLGHSRRTWSDLLGLVIFALTVLGVASHAGLRWLGARKSPAAPHHGPTKRVFMYGTYERVWHWVMALSVIGLIVTGLKIHYPGILGALSFTAAVFVHNVMAGVMIFNAFLSLFFHLATNEIRQYIPARAGLLERLTLQARYYLRGIFLREAHPMAKRPEAKLNPLQQLTYVGLLNVLFPLQIITGLLLWVAGLAPQLLPMVGGLAVVGPLHNLGSWLLLTFMVMHVYLTTTGHTLTSNIKAMIDGWEEIPTDDEASKGA